MMLPPHLTRRQALRTAALGALALPLLSSRAAAAETAAPTPKPAPLRLGCATYGQRTIAVDDLLLALKALRIPNVAFYKLHLDVETATPEQVSAVVAKVAAAGLTMTGTGVVAFKNNEAACRKAFENAKLAQLPTIVCKPDLNALPLVEKLAKEYDQRLAIHNHGPEDKVYPSPYDVMKAIAPLDARIGLCLDLGHAMRAKADPVEAIRQCAPRLYDVHLKDSAAIPGSDKDIPMEIGAGRMDIRGILRALLEIKYAGVASFEYEKPIGNPITGLAESVGYVRGVLAGMARS
jgi:inosose dehydratase